MAEMLLYRRRPFYALMAFLISSALWVVAPTIEGTLFPVMRDLRAADLVYTPEGARFVLVFDKVRNCDVYGSAVYNDITGESIDRVVLTERRSVTSHPEGQDFRSGPWMLRGVNNLNAITYYIAHRCHWGFSTVTKAKITPLTSRFQNSLEGIQ